VGYLYDQVLAITPAGFVLVSLDSQECEEAFLKHVIQNAGQD
jgi:hypothetical protein